MRKRRIIRFWIKYVPWPAELKMSLRCPFTLLSPASQKFWALYSEKQWATGFLGLQEMLKRESTWKPSGPPPMEGFFYLCFLKWVVFYFILSSKLGFGKLWAGLLREREPVRAGPPSQGPWSRGVFQGSALALCPVCLWSLGASQRRNKKSGSFCHLLPPSPSSLMWLHKRPSSVSPTSPLVLSLLSHTV